MPIITSLLDTDFYKFTMGQVAFRRFPRVPVTDALINRTQGTALPDYIDEAELRREIDHVRELRFTDDELSFLRASAHIELGVFGEDYLTFLASVRLPGYRLQRQPRYYELLIEGPWPEAILWETLALCIVTELFSREAVRRQGRSLDEAWSEGERRLHEKIERLGGEPRLRFIDFGTRRRFSFAWQRHLVETLARELPGRFTGTSNVLLAKELGLQAYGTFAHEMYMVLAGLAGDDDEALRASHRAVLDLWWDAYGEPLSVALTDNYTSDFFFEEFTREQARLWRGLRQDSGDPFAFTEQAIAFYERLDIDPATKLIVYSDGLDVERMLSLVERYGDRVGQLFGWGTNLTNDLGFDPPSLIVKPVVAAGHKVGKLSDNLDKATGDAEAVERLMRVFGRTEVPRLGVRY